ncbi:unnamed protein product [Macrosiphum euphorbiae]|uniref:Uncharacterized protein n=1 Tax=Macrosiphum euphorbiae TaxID=13131 RepID=A0AAV0Y568_9HEMI|nr:unnamed protein product [Macrosiphum euphorbiae]
MDETDDGDCGSNWRRGADAVKVAVTEWPAPQTLFVRSAGCLRTAWPALWARYCPSCSGHSHWNLPSIHSVAAVEAYGMRQPGDRAMLDALVPAVRGMEDVLCKSKNAVSPFE